MKSFLNLPYGGALVQRVAAPSSLQFPPATPELSVNKIIESDFFNIATGAFSPLHGFMGSKDFHSVCTSNRLSSQDLVWTIPIVFDITDAEKEKIGNHEQVLLRSQESGELIGFIRVREVFPHDRELRIKGTYQITDSSHPGVKLVSEMGPHLVAGEITAFSTALSQTPLTYPAQVRAQLTEMGLKRVAGFQTRNVVHRAHEYLQRVALEVCDGLLVHPVVGWKKAGDFRPEAVKLGYISFIDAYYPKERVLLAFLNLAMRYAGPKEAVFHAIVRKNFGCSHFIVGRDHAGVGGFYDSYAAHDFINTLPDMGIEFLKLREPFYCRRCEGIATDHSCGHAESDREYISGTKIRKILVEGKNPEHHIFRTEVLESLRPLGEKGLFYETH